MKLFSVVFLAVLATSSARDCPNKKSSNSKLFCYYSKLTDIDGCYCSHVILPANSDAKAVERARQQTKGAKILVTANEFNQRLIDLLKTTKIDGLEISLKKLDSKNDITDFISTVRSKLGSDLYLALSVPAKNEMLAKYYDFKSLSKHADVFVLQTAFLGASKNVTFHPSRLSGLWDMQNTDSIVDLVSGLGAPLSKLVITAPVQAFHFTLQNQEYSTPGSPAVELKSLTRNELCDLMSAANANWTLERDQDQTGPYIYSKKNWIAFEDSSSIDIKAKYARIRGLSGLALKDLSQDEGRKCGPSILESAYNGLSRQARAPRGAVLHSLEREILETPSRPLDSVQVSPYRITRLVDVEGHVHIIRQDTRTEFTCSRQGYFVHPRSCNRFYRCVKFDQLTDEYSVFEFDCPAGLAFDERVEVCVWPGSLPEGQPCAGSSEIAPVPRERFVCPHEPGYYADPENCRWFFACLDHGKSPLSAYEFRCPFGLVFDSDRLLCEWSWLVPKCASGDGYGLNLASQYTYGGSSSGIGYSSGVDLDQYNGLGALGVVKLGGINGKIYQPLVYSNVGGAAGYQNGGYVNGLGLQARQSLQNAGLLKTNLVTGFGSNQGLNSNIQYTTGGKSATLSSSSYHYNSGFGTGNLNVGTAADLGASNLNAGAAFGGKLDLIGVGQLNGGYASTGDQLLFNNLAGSKVESQANSLNLGFDSNNSGAKSYQNTVQNQNQQIGVGNIRYQTDEGSAYSSNGLGATSSQSFSQYQRQNGQEADGYDSRTVGAKSYQAQNGQNIDLNNLGAIGTRINPGQNEKVVNSIRFGSAYDSSEPVVKSYESQSQYGDRGEQAEAQNIDLNNVQYQTNLRSSLTNDISNTGTKYSLGYPQYQYDQAVAVNNGLSQGSYTVNYPGSQGSVLQGTGGIGATSSQSITQYHDQNRYINQASNLADTFGSAAPQGFIGRNEQVFVNVDQNDVKTGDFGANLLYKSSGADTFGSKLSTTNYQDGIAGNVNIVGGGYSAVGASKSGIEINHNGENYLGIDQSTPTPISFSTYSSVPTVTSVPVPALKVAAGFQRYDGGVIANIPELQFKVQRGPALHNISSDFVRFASTTPSTVGFVGQTNQEQGVYSGATSHHYQTQTSSGSGGGYVSSSPSLTFGAGQIQDLSKNTYVVSSTVRPAIVQQNIAQPTASVQTGGGYVYAKPSIVFEETPRKIVTYSNPTTISPIANEGISVQPLLPIDTVKIQPVAGSGASSYSYQSKDSGFRGYKYEKPIVAFEETPRAQVISNYNVISTPRPVILQEPRVFVTSTVAPVIEQKVTVQPASYSFAQNVETNGYDYTRPAQNENPAVISRFSIRQPAVQQTFIQPAVSAHSYQDINLATTYESQQPLYQKTVSVPEVAYQQPTQKTIVENYVQNVQPAIISSYHYQKPEVTRYSFKDIVQPVVSTYSPVTVRPASVPVVSYQQPTQKTIVENYVQNVQPAVVSSYHYQKPEVTKYSFKDIIQPVVSKYLPVTEKPVVSTYLPVTENPAVISTYNYVAPSTFRPVISTYSYSNPTTVKPGVVSAYNYVSSTTPRPDVYTYSYVAPSTFKPAVVSTYNYVAPSTLRPAVSTYTYSTPSTLKPAVLVSKQPSVISSYSYVAPSTPKPEILVEQRPVQFKGYDYPRPSVSFVEEPEPIISTYDNRQLVEEVPFIKKNAYVTGQLNLNKVKSYQYEQPVVVENYQAPIVNEGYENSNANLYDSSNSYYINNVQTVTNTPIYSTPRPTFSSTIASVLGTKSASSTQAPNFYFHDSRLSSTPNTRISAFTTESVPLTKEYLPSQIVTTSRPIAKYSFSSLDDQYQYIATPSPSFIESTTPLPIRTRLRVTSPVPTFVVPTEQYLPVRSRVRYTTVSPIEVSSPSENYLPVRRVTSVAPIEVTTLSRDYLPGRSNVRYTTTGIPVEVDEVSSRRPVNVYTPSTRTIIKQNDFQSVLSAKLGAQCTCVTNALNSRKKQKIIVVDYDDEDDGYVVDNNNNDGQVGNIIENYQYDAQKVVDITPTPQIILQSTASEADVSSTYALRKRVRVRPATHTSTYEPVTEAVELFVKKDVTSAPSDKEIVSAVKTGLKLVKQAAKEGAEEAISKYSPITGSKRDAIECQRPGLFRHPSQCNKFYACRWDCTKNKYTLHVFNCPVHLTFDSTQGACNWPSQGPACTDNTLLPSE